MEWKLEVPSKIIQFLWKLLNGALPFNERRSKLFPDASPLCAFCNLELESEKHLFFTCEFSRVVWFGSQLGVLSSYLGAGDFLSINSISESASLRQGWTEVAILWLLFLGRIKNLMHWRFSMPSLTLLTFGLKLHIIES